MQKPIRIYSGWAFAYGEIFLWPSGVVFLFDNLYDVINVYKYGVATDSHHIRGEIMAKRMNAALILLIAGGLYMSGCAASGGAHGGRALGDSEKEASTGAVTTLNVAEILDEHPTATIAELLQGRVAGVQVIIELREKLMRALERLGEFEELLESRAFEDLRERMSNATPEMQAMIPAFSAKLVRVRRRGKCTRIPSNPFYCSVC